MKRAVLAATVGGLALFTVVIVWQGAADVGQAIARVGWGLVAVIAWHFVPLIVDSLAWHHLFHKPRPRFGLIVWARWLGEAINHLLPVAQIGGDIAKAHLLTGRGIDGAESGGTVVVDTTISAATQMLFGLIGALLLIAAVNEPELAWGIGLGLVLMLALIGVFYCAQRGGLFQFIIGLAGRLSTRLAPAKVQAGARSLDQQITRVYQRPRVVLRAAGIRLLGWIAGVGEVWLALWYLDVPMSLADAFLLEALAQAIRGAAFFIPGAIGVQEAGLALIASAVGLSPMAGLTVSLAKRIRELAFGVPGLLVWQWVEGRSLKQLLEQPASNDT